MIETVIKLGGSVVTSDDAPGLFDAGTVDRLADELLSAGEGTILVHGTGRVGKPPALEHGYVDTGMLPREKRAVALDIRRRIADLNHAVMHVLLARGLPVVRVDPVLAFDGNLAGPRGKGVIAQIRGLIDGGFVPVLHGDFVPCSDGSVRVLSSDHIMFVLARVLAPRRVIFLTDVDGVFRSEGIGGGRALLERLSAANAGEMRADASDGDDVSGGMAKKVAHALDVAHYCEECIIANGREAGVLRDLLAGRDARCTRVDA